MKVKKVSDLTEDDKRKLDVIAYEHLGPKKLTGRMTAKVARPEFVVMTDSTYCGILFRHGLYFPTPGTSSHPRVGGITRVRGPEGSEVVRAALSELTGCDLILYFREDERYLKALGFARFRGTVKASEAVLGEPLVIGPTQGVLDLCGLPW